jgi:2-oxoglutarate ferredoxin oxidoreductase subunit gamma
MVQTDLTIAGVGGQGSILAGIILGTAAVTYDKKYAVQTQAYSSELRGGFAATWVIVSDDLIVFPRVTRPDVNTVKNTFGISATSIARNKLNAPVTANMIMLGALCKVTGVVSREALEQAIATAVPKGKEQLNLDAFTFGLETVEAIS